MRKVGWLVVGLGLPVAGAGHYAIYSTSLSGDASRVSIVEAASGLCLAVVGLLLVQLRS